MYTTKDFKIIVVLYYYGYKILGIDSSDKCSKVFTFEDKPLKAEDLVFKFYNHELKVDPNNFFDAEDKVRSMIHS